MICQRPHCCGRVVRFPLDGLARPLADDDMRLHVESAQRLQELDANFCSCGPGDGDYYPLPVWNTDPHLLDMVFGSTRVLVVFAWDLRT